MEGIYKLISQQNHKLLNECMIWKINYWKNVVIKWMDETNEWMRMTATSVGAWKNRCFQVERKKERKKDR